MKDKKILFAILGIIIIIFVILIFYIKVSKVKEDFEGGAEYNEEQLSNFDFKIIALNEKVKSKIIDIEKLKIAIKEYIYKNGLVEASEAKYITYAENNKKMTLKFQLNNKENTKLVVTFDLNGDNYEIFSY